MVNGTFDIAVDTPKYHRRGVISLQSNGGAIAAQMNVSDIEGLRFSGTCHDKEFEFKGEEEFGDLGLVQFDAKGNVWGNSLTINCETSVGKVTIFGTRISTQAGEFKSSHESLMAAAAGDFESGARTMYSGTYGDAS